MLKCLGVVGKKGFCELSSEEVVDVAVVISGYESVLCGQCKTLFSFLFFFLILLEHKILHNTTLISRRSITLIAHPCIVDGGRRQEHCEKSQVMKCQISEMICITLYRSSITAF